MWVMVCHRMVVCKAEVRRPLKRVRSKDLWLWWSWGMGVSRRGGSRFFSLNKFECFLASDKAADDCSYLDLLWLTSAVFRKNVKVEGGPRTLSTVMREPSCPHTPGTCSSSDCITAGGVANPVALSSPSDWLLLEKTANRPQMTLLRKTADTSWNIQEETPYFVWKKIYTFRCIQNLFEVSVLKSWGRVEEAKLKAGVSVCELIRFHAKKSSSGC